MFPGCFGSHPSMTILISFPAVGFLLLYLLITTLVVVLQLRRHSWATYSSVPLCLLSSATFFRPIAVYDLLVDHNFDVHNWSFSLGNRNDYYLDDHSPYLNLHCVYFYLLLGNIIIPPLWFTVLLAVPVSGNPSSLSLPPIVFVVPRLLSVASTVAVPCTIVIPRRSLRLLLFSGYVTRSVYLLGILFPLLSGFCLS